MRRFQFNLASCCVLIVTGLSVGLIIKLRKHKTLRLMQLIPCGLVLVEAVLIIFTDTLLPCCSHAYADNELLLQFRWKKRVKVRKRKKCRTNGQRHQGHADALFYWTKLIKFLHLHGKQQLKSAHNKHKFPHQCKAKNVGSLVVTSSYIRIHLKTEQVLIKV